MPRPRKWQTYRQWWIEACDRKWENEDIINAILSELARLDGMELPVQRDAVVRHVRELVNHKQETSMKLSNGLELTAEQYRWRKCQRPSQTVASHG